MRNTLYVILKCPPFWNRYQAESRPLKYDQRVEATNFQRNPNKIFGDNPVFITND